ncbi:methionyl-tRNA formyltransferase [Jatrophihabitans telluris]|uniref:Methionyl-tRNA formyltransferase n=1 Tax=Jatrophihabitans telluris TaxID=2038343 RepID=A0ABY4R2L5_9ACTN|nr:methionyl-tRNA formyltransferase [Jatrophihabitans telluris]UQX90068.1 methionyl-tRNA formyltransferase [Jatrophihabitans telluris]
MRLLFAGTPEVARPSLQALIDSPNHEVVGVLSRPESRSGRGRSLTASPVAALAQDHSLPLFSPARPSDPDFVAALTELAVDACPVVAYGALLRQPTLSVPRIGWINLHFSLLPAWRGAAPVQHALLNGDEFTGASTFLIGPGLDDGPVFGVLTERIRPDDTSGNLLERLSEAGAGLLLATMDGIADGSLSPVVQPVDGVSLAPKLTPADAQVHFDTPAIALERRIRACTPAPGAWTEAGSVGADRLKLGPVRIATAEHGLARGDLKPGELEVRRRAVFVGTLTDAVELGSVQPAGKKSVPAADWARGARLVSGTRLG